MLKIKSNTNEFIIIFLRRLERKRMLKRSRLAFVQFSTPSSFLLLFFFFSFLVSALFCFSPLFLFNFGAPLSASTSLFCFSPLFLFFRLPFIFQPKILFFNPNVFQFFSPNVFASVQPLFSSSFFCFILFWFSPLFSLLAPPFFSFL